MNQTIFNEKLFARLIMSRLFLFLLSLLCLWHLLIGQTPEQPPEQQQPARTHIESRSQKKVSLMSYVFLNKESAIWCPSLEETTDSLVGSYEGTHNGFTPYVTNDGKRCYFFDGTGDYLTTDFEWESEGPAFVSMWVWVDDMVPEQQQLFGFTHSLPEPLFEAYIVSGVLTFTYGDATDGTLTADFSGHYKKWVHLYMCSRGDDNSGMEIYIDGVLAASKGTSDYPALSEDNLGYLTIGGINPGGSTKYFGGMIDDFRIGLGFLFAWEIDWLASLRGALGTPPPLGWDPCPEVLREHRAASWKITDRIGSTLAPVAKSISGSGELTNNNTVQIQHPKNGRTFVGPAAYFDFSATESLTSLDADLRPSNNDWTFVHICWHDMDSILNDEASQFLVSCAMRREAAPSTALIVGVLKTGNWRPRMILEIKGSLKNVYFDELPAEVWDEPLLVVVRQDTSAGNINARFIGLISRTLHATITHSTTLAAADSEEFILGRWLKTSSGSYTATRGIQDCWTVLQDYAATEADAFAFRDHIWQQKQFIDTFVRGQSQ